MALKSNVALLLLQLVLYRQQEFSHNDTGAKLNELLVNPVVDEIVLDRFTNHRLVKLYAPELVKVRLRALKKEVNDLFSAGLPDKNMPVTVITLANHFYYTRVKELEQDQIPKINEQLRDIDAQLQGSQQQHKIEGS
ncbi:LAME_0F07382g1_1 [Lachancea meyersii CBS 8951]|uniref:LAME_0F07382g1_1 n=1 Tax=Lachancea meyersii CBS 8951 TaxID=1266667 RepID=A0A1G4JU03_9SACH|nr:LAME_0F07382g1_1 [Lachancea meyersii CBS 8951]